MVFEAQNISFAYGDRPMVAGFSTRIARGDRIALVGPNGAGKSTLLKLLTGQLQPTSGTVRLGANVQMATLDQGRAALDPAATLIQTISAGHGDTIMVGGQPKHIMSYLKDFLFSPDQANASVSVLSGGERGRLLLARSLSLPSNVLVLDEPTNDLDLETLDLLQEMITDYPGTVLLVSHDRDFIDRVATSTIVFEEEGLWREYPGGYSDIVTQRGAGVVARTASTSSKATPAANSNLKAPSKIISKQRLSQKDTFALQSLPEKMDALAKRVKQLQDVLDSPNLYEKDPARFNAAAAELGKIQLETAALEEQWLELEMRREELGT
jgi:ABC transport system ATP-binding/permease protein